MNAVVIEFLVLEKFPTAEMTFRSYPRSSATYIVR